MFTEKQFHKHGFLPEEEPDPKHWDIETLHLSSRVPSRVSLREFSSPVSNQGSVGSCVAHAVVNAIELLRIKEHGRGEHVDLSPLALYYRTREQRDPSHVNQDTGSFVSHACKTLAVIGVPPLSLHDNSNAFDKRPSLIATQSSYENRSKAYYTIKSHGKERVYSVKRALADGFPVVYGTKVGPQWFRYRPQSVLTIPMKEEIIGGHATCLVGYAPGYDSKTVFVGKNSWGVGWGDQGYYYIHEDVIASEFSRDFWVVTDH